MTVAGYCTACCEQVPDFLPGGTGGRRPRARCPKCRALERHRFLALLLENLAIGMHGRARVLDIAPSPFITDRVRRMDPASYVRVDVDPEADSREVDVVATLTQLPFEDATFDLAICYHVLEHIPEDEKAMGELRRILSSSGIALVQVPFRPGALTEEDPKAPPEERARRFGQADHVRRYGHDFERRLERAGLSGRRIRPIDVVGAEVASVCGLIPEESVWVLYRTTERDALVQVDSSLTLPSLTGMISLVRTVEESLAGQVESASLRREEAEAEALHWRQRFERIRNNPVVDIVARTSRPLRRVLGRRRSGTA